MVRLKQDYRYIIRLMQDRDIPQVLDIDHEAFPTQWPHPTYSTFKQELRNRMAYYFVASRQNEVTSEAITEKTDKRSYKDRLQQLKNLLYHSPAFNDKIPPPSRDHIIGMAGFWIMAGEAHLTTIAVRNAYRQQGVGERLLISIIDKGISLNADVVTLEVRVSNKQAQSLYEKYGFSEAGMRHAYYSDNGENAIIMTTDNITSPSFQSHFQQLKQTYEQKWGHYATFNQVSEDNNE